MSEPRESCDKLVEPVSSGTRSHEVSLTLNTRNSPTQKQQGRRRQTPMVSRKQISATNRDFGIDDGTESTCPSTPDLSSTSQEDHASTSSKTAQSVKKSILRSEEPHMVSVSHQQQSCASQPCLSSSSQQGSPSTSDPRQQVSMNILTTSSNRAEIVPDEESGDSHSQLVPGSSKTRKSNSKSPKCDIS